MGLAENIKRLRKKKGWSQAELAKQIDSHLSNINRIETGKYNPSLSLITKLAEVFDVTIDYLISNTKKDFQEVKIEDKSLLQRVKLIDSLNPEDKKAVIRIIDSLLTKEKVFYLLNNQKEVVEEMVK